MRTKLKRILSAALACVMLLALLPATALAAIDRSNKSTVQFVIVNGTWNNVNFGSDAVVSDDKTTVTFETYYSTKVGAYVYTCSLYGGTMEKMLQAILGASGGGLATDYIIPDEGYNLNGMNNQDWAVNDGGGLKANNSKTAYQQMALVKQSTHAYDTHGGDERDGFLAGTVYTLTLLKNSYSVTGTIDNGSVTYGSQTVKYKEQSAAMTFTPDARYEITGVTVNGEKTPFTLNSDGSYTYPAQTVTKDITVQVTTTLRAYNVIYNANNGTSEPITDNNGGNGYTGEVPLATNSKGFSYGDNIFLGWSESAQKVVKFGDTLPAMVKKVTIFDADKNVYAVWGEDSNGDGVADVYQARVTFQVVGGTWNDTQDTLAKSYLVTPTTDSKIPADKIPASTHDSDRKTTGTWDRDPATATIEAGKEYTYTITYPALDTLTVTATGYTGEYDGNSHGITVTADEGAVIKYYSDAAHTTASTNSFTDVTNGTKVYYVVTKTDAATVTGFETVTITPKPVTVTADSKSKTYDTDDPELTATVSGTIGSDTVNYGVTRAKGEDAGTYTITASGAATQGNYIVTYVNGTFTINKANRPDDAQISADSYNAPYDGNAHGITVNGATLTGDTVYYRTNGSNWNTTAPTRTNVQDAETIYVMVENPNYITDTANATITITQREVTIKVDDAEKFYDQADPDFTGSITTGTLVKAGDLGTITYVRTNTDEGVGKYERVLDAKFTANPNYAVTVIKGDFTIKTASVDGAAVTAIGGSRVYNGEPFAASAEVTGATGYNIYYSTDNGETWSTDVPSVTNVADGTVTVMVKATKTGYEDLVGSAPATITITPRDVTLTSASDSKVYDRTPLTNSTVTVGGSGFVKEEGATYNVTGSQTKIGSSVNAFTYTPNDKTDARNYNITKTEGTLTVTAATGVTVTKTAKQNTVLIGNTITWTVTVKNTGNDIAKDLKLTDTLSGVTITAPAGVNYQKFDLDPGESVSFTVTYKPNKIGCYINHVDVYQPDDVKVAEADSDKVNYFIPAIDDKPTLNTEDHVAYIIGYQDGTVRPQNNITRAEVATIFFRLLDNNSRTAYWSQKNGYTDVSLNDWFNNAISTLSNAGVITGYPNGTFQPNASITRAEFAAIAARFSDEAFGGRCSFTDVPATHWASSAIALAEQLGWINGYSDGTFRPDQPITRAEAMTLINRVLERAVDEDGMLPDMVTWTDNQPSDWFYEAVQEATNSHDYTRTDTRVPSQSFNYENWVKILPAPDWAALENAWSTANGQ